MDSQYSLHVLVRHALAFGLLATSGIAGAAGAYRCEIDGKVIYSDAPCSAGKQTEIATPAGPSSADRAEALRRQKADAANAHVMQTQRERKEKKDDAVRKKDDAEHARHARSCAKLAAKIKLGRAELYPAGRRQLATRQTRLHHAEEDYAATCGKLDALK